MKRILDVILVGVGNRGRWPLTRCRAETGWRIVALVDPSEAMLAAAREATGLPPSAAYRELASALDATRADAVILCSPTLTHAPLAKLAIDRGLAVLTEKGMAPDWLTAVDLVRHAREKGGIFAVAQNYRYGGLEQLIQRSLQPGASYSVEQPYLMDYVQHRVRPVPRTLNYPFASVWDMSCHHFDNLFFWLGPVAEMTAQSYRAPFTAYVHDNNTSAFLRFRNGVSVNYVHTHDASRASLRIELHGRSGALVVRDQQVEFSTRPNENFGTAPVAVLPLPEYDTETGVLADFHAYVTTGREPGISGYRNLEVMAMCELMVRSIQQGRTVQREELDDVRG